MVKKMTNKITHTQSLQSVSGVTQKISCIATLTQAVKNSVSVKLGIGKICFETKLEENKK
jgi:hypothetical protein